MPPRPQATRTPTYPRFNVTRKTPRRWPLVLRVGMGGVHADIFFPVLLHGLIACLIVYLVQNHHVRLGLPSSIVPSLSIVVGLMLVFRNQTSYERFWNGRHNVTAMVTGIRNLARVILTHCVPLEIETSPVLHRPSFPGATSAYEDDDASTLNHSKKFVTAADRADTERTIRLLLAILYATKHNLRHEWTSTMLAAATIADGNGGPIRSAQGRRWSPLSRSNTNSSLNTMVDGATTPLLRRPEYTALLPPNLSNFEEEGLGLPLQLTVQVETYIRRACRRGWIIPPLASQLSALINSVVDAIGSMEQIRTTPVPVAHLIHQRQVLAAFGIVLPFAMVDDMGWWTILIVSVVMFTLYGIEGIGSQLEDPFGYDRNDIKMDDIVEDTRREILVLLQDWKDDGQLFSR